jgi:transcriptional regulator with XRE-family HTH domain
MKTQFAHDLRLARRKAGYLQRDVAHLLGAGDKYVSALESGRRRPTLAQIVTLSVIYGRSFESLFTELMREAEAKLRDRILTMPRDVRGDVGRFNRPASIDGLARRLADNQHTYGGA